MDAYSFGSDGKCNCEYDADMAIMTAFIHLEQPPSTPTLDEFLTIPMKIVDRRTEQHIGTSTYGARVAFKSRFSDEFGVVISQDSFTWLRSFAKKKSFPNLPELEQEEMANRFPTMAGPSFSFPLAPDQAKVLKPHLRIVLVGTIPNTQIYQDQSFLPATIDDPLEVIVEKLYLHFFVDEVRVVDSRTGKTIVNFAHIDLAVK